MRLEVCIDRIESALAAEQGGADRLEVCGSLAVGGVTPSWGLVAQCREKCRVDVMMMIRPHDGSFCYSSADLGVMLRDIAAAKQLGVTGVVWGALTAAGRVDREACRRLLDAARPLEVTFHRAFDVARDPSEAIDDLLDLGVDRLLTSGQQASVEDGMPLVRRLVERCADRLSVMAGAGIHAANVARIVRETGVAEVHASASVPEDDGKSAAELQFGPPSRVTSLQSVQALAAALRGGP